MDSSKLPKISAEANQDSISNLPAIVIEKILKRLPIHMAAKMSVLSKKWKDNWLSCRHLVFNTTFWVGQADKNGAPDGQKASNIISSVLFHHNGPLQKFHLYIPNSAEGMCIQLSQWLCFLSKTSVKKIALINWDECEPMPSYIFSCNELVKLRLEFFVLNPPPSDFKGFANLRSLQLVDVEFKTDIVGKLIASCPRLVVIILAQCSNLDHVAINVPSLEYLVIKGNLNCLRFKNVARLKYITLDLTTVGKAVALNSIAVLATSCKLHCLQFGGQLCELLAAGGVARSLPLVFNYLNELILTELNLGRIDVYCFVVGMIQSCPCIKHLEFSVSENASVPQKKIDYDEYKLDHLIKVKFTGITGSSAELQMIEYLLAISVALEFFFFKCRNLDATSELKVSRDLLRLRRASTKAQLVCLE